MPDIQSQGQIQKRIEQNVQEARIRKVDSVPATELRLEPIPEPNIMQDVSSPRPVIGPVLVFLRKLLRWLLRPIFGRQVLLNEAIILRLAAHQRRTSELRVTLEHLALQVDKLERQNLDLKRQLSDTNAQLAKLKHG